MNDAIAVSVSHCVDVTTIVEAANGVKTLCVQLDVDRIHIARKIMHASTVDAQIHALNRPLVEQMHCVWFRIMPEHAFVRIIWLAILVSRVNIHRRRVRQQTNARRIIRATATCAKPLVTTMTTVWPMKNVSVEHVNRSVITTPHVEPDKFARIDYVKSVAEMI